MPLLVSTAWLKSISADPDLVVLWTDQGSHDEALIAGARAVPHESLMTMQGGHGLAATDALVEVLRTAGVSNQSHVVVYGEPLSAGWLFFVLDYLGHTRVSMLDGGITKWRAEERPIARTPVAPPPGTFTPRARPQARATADDLHTRHESRRRGPARRAQPPRIRGGAHPRREAPHLAGRLRRSPPAGVQEPERARRSFSARPAPPLDRAAVTYCQIGLRSSALYFAAR